MSFSSIWIKIICAGRSWYSLPSTGRRAIRDLYHPDHTAWQLLDALVAMEVAGIPAEINDE
jgi:hypothetical protein